MSTFSSVVNKSGKKFAPKATARRNVPRRAPSITSNSPDPPPPARTLLPSTQDAAKFWDASQVQSATEQDATASAPPAHAQQSDGTTTPLDIAPPKTDSEISDSRTAKLPRLTGQAKKDAMRERWAAHQEKTFIERVAKRQYQAQPTVVDSDEVAHRQPALSEPSHGHDTNSEEQAPSVGHSTRSTRSRKAGTKSKSDARATDTSDTPPGYSTAISIPEMDASTEISAPRKRRKVGAKRPRPTCITAVTQTVTTMSGEDPPEASVATAAAETLGEEATTVPSRAKRKRRAKKTMQEVAAEIVADAAGDTSDANEDNTRGTKKRKRKWTRKIPEGAEDHEIAPSEVKMADLVKDKRLGKGSKLEARLQEIDWDEVKKKRKEAEEEAEKQRELEREEKRTGRSARQDDVPAAPTVPKMTLRDGRVVMDEESRMVDRHAEMEQATDAPVKELDVDDVTRRVNQSTIGRQPGVKQKGHRLVLQRLAHVRNGLHDDQQDVPWTVASSCQVEIYQRRTHEPCSGPQKSDCEGGRGHGGVLADVQSGL
jgi:transcription factor TFIIIB component B''